MEQVPDTYSALFLGYAALWTLVCVYLVWLGAKLNAIEKQRSK